MWNVSSTILSAVFYVLTFTYLRATTVFFSQSNILYWIFVFFSVENFKISIACGRKIFCNADFSLNISVLESLKTYFFWLSVLILWFSDDIREWNIFRLFFILRRIHVLKISEQPLEIIYNLLVLYIIYTSIFMFLKKIKLHCSLVSAYSVLMFYTIVSEWGIGRISNFISKFYGENSMFKYVLTIAIVEGKKFYSYIPTLKTIIINQMYDRYRIIISYKISHFSYTFYWRLKFPYSLSSVYVFQFS